MEADSTRPCGDVASAKSSAASPLSVEWVSAEAVNLAFQQNGIPVVPEVEVKNESTGTISAVECAFSSDPPLLSPKTLVIDSLRPGEGRSLHDAGLRLDCQPLREWTEAIRGTFRLEIRGRREDGEIVAMSSSRPFMAVAADQWLGLGLYPELLCSFVTPNLPGVVSLMKGVAAELERTTGNGAIRGYLDGKARAYEICAAVYEVVHAQGIQYALPPSSFLDVGQRVRFADAVLADKIGTCLDTTLLFASLLEQCRLNPVLMVEEDHAYVGCHLVDRHFSNPTLDDLQSIRKLVAADEFVVLETTLATDPDSRFAEAEACAFSDNLARDGKFRCAIDVRRARASHILPLPLKRAAGQGIEWASAAECHVPSSGEPLRELKEEVDLDALQGEGHDVPARLHNWQQKLLDLSLRNRLLDTKDGGFALPIASPDVELLEDKIASEEKLSVGSLDDLLGEKDRREWTPGRASDPNHPVAGLLKAELERKRLWAPVSETELGKRLKKLYRQGRVDLEEGGVNTIFLALGFLEWRESPRDARSHRAPLLLLPVRLTRESGGHVRVERHDEESVVNVTLLELLRRQFQIEIPGLDPLPGDESGVDVGRVFQIFRAAIRGQSGWEVHEEAVLGRFAFSKFIMWKDLASRKDDLCKNGVVRHLIEGGGLFDDGVEVFPPEEIGAHIDPSGLYCPMSADSSQLAAVLYSALGKSFVLHGPPGTGKSQTITNLIAHNLALGRRVLFVSEKKAALDVVYRRLSSIGLRPFCLELHSNHSGKSEVMRQYAEALAVADASEPEEWERTTARLQKERESLDDYVAELHHLHGNGYSAYRCLSWLLGHPDVQEEGVPPVPDPLAKTPAGLGEARRLLGELVKTFGETDRETLRALAFLRTMDWTPAVERELRAEIEDYRAKTEAVDAAVRSLAEALSVPCAIGRDGASVVAGRLPALLALAPFPAPMLGKGIGAAEEALRSYLHAVFQDESLSRKFGDYDGAKVRNLAFGALRARIAEAKQSFFLVRFFKVRALLSELKDLKKPGGKPLTLPELESILPDAENWASVVGIVAREKPSAEPFLGSDWRSRCQSEEEGIGWGERASAAQDALREIASVSPELAEALRGRLVDFFGRSMAGEEPGGLSPTALCAPFLESWSAFAMVAETFAGRRGVAPAVHALPDRFADLSSLFAAALEAFPALREAMLYRTRREEVAALGIGDWSTPLEAGTIPPDSILPAFEKSVAASSLEAILDQSPALCRFSSASQEERIRAFRELDDKCAALAREMVVAKLTARLPRRRQGICPEGTELGIIRRECEKRARQKPVRQLLEMTPNLTPLLKPCFLMSPLSVAQYLPPDSSLFDLVVFDEASQIPVWDAIGVIARGHQLVVVGDPKQMPPTNFFQKGASEEAMEEESEDLESILDECIAAGLHSTYLNWHYRSRHESLISFSNHHYYDDRLVTFPAARMTDRLGVRFHFVPDGLYDRRQTRTNRKEAEALVAYLAERLSDTSQRHRSIGVVTFSEAQQGLISGLFDEERDRHPEWEPFIGDSAEEPMFVKNLENVQGDERDVILFSVCYAPDVNGFFSMNFGPLNRQGGERRLNVAVTRAREQVVVFSSIHGSQIDYSRTSAAGAAHLRHFLDYAEKGIASGTVDEGRGRSDGLVEAVARFLEKNGYEVERGVGRSLCRVDLAVRNPDRPDEYLVGIECDGVSYAEQRTTRDRDHLRDSILARMGWRILHVWSVDWRLSRAKAERHLLDEIKKAGEKPAPASVPPPPRRPVPPPFVPPPPDPPRKASPAVSEHCKPYVVWRPPAGLTQEAFEAPSARGKLARQIEELLEAEGPVCATRLYREIARAWGFSRPGRSIVETIESAMPRTVSRTPMKDDAVLWAPGVRPADFSVYRVSDDDGERRPIDEIPPEELANAMVDVLLDLQACDRDVLYRETLRLLGFSTLTKKARAYLDDGYGSLERSGKV